MANADEVVVTYTLNASQYEAGARKVVAATQATNAATRQAGGAAGSAGGGFAGFGSVITEVGRQINMTTPVVGDLINVVKAAGIAALGAGIGMAAFAFKAMTAAADFEAMEIGMRAYTSSAEENDKVMRRLLEVARMPGLGVNDVVQAALALRAVGFDARLAERAILGFGNALVAAGKGKEELGGVILALGQMVSKGKISAEEINQIAERVPQIRQLMQAAFGTANTEELAKKVGPQQFILGLIAALEQLPKVAGGAKNGFSNVGDAINYMMVSAGKALNSLLLPAFEKLAGFVDFLTSKNVFAGIVDRFVSSSGAISGLVDSMAKTVGLILPGVQNIVAYIMGAEGLEQGMVRAGAVFIAALERAPLILQAVVTLLTEIQDQMGAYLKQILDTIGTVLEALGKGFKFGPWTVGASPEASKAGKAIRSANVSVPGFEKSSILFGAAFSGTLDRAKEIEAAFSNYVPSSEVANDKSLGGFTSAEQTMLQQIEKNTRDTAKNTDKKGFDPSKHIVGGGDLARLGVTPQEIAASRGQRHAGAMGEAQDLIFKALSKLAQEMHTAVVGVRVSMARDGSY